MLVLSRRCGESLWVGDAEIVVVKIRGNQVSIGINAPKKIVVDRNEVRMAKRKEREQKRNE